MFHWLGTGKVASLPWTQRAWLGPRWMIQLWLPARRPLQATDFCFAGPTSILLAWLEARYFSRFCISLYLHRHQGGEIQQEGKGLCTCTRVLGGHQSRLGQASWAHCVNGRSVFLTIARHWTVTMILKLQFWVMDVVFWHKITTIKEKVLSGVKTHN